jgi:hypothetical protein
MFGPSRKLGLLSQILSDQGLTRNASITYYLGLGPRSLLPAGPFFGRTSVTTSETRVRY